MSGYHTLNVKRYVGWGCILIEQFYAIIPNLPPCYSSHNVFNAFQLYDYYHFCFETASIYSYSTYIGQPGAYAYLWI